MASGPTAWASCPERRSSLLVMGGHCAGCRGALSTHLRSSRFSGHRPQLVVASPGLRPSRRAPRIISSGVIQPPWRSFRQTFIPACRTWRSPASAPCGTRWRRPPGAVRRWPGPTHPSGMPGAQVHPLTPQPRPPAAPPASNPVGTPLGLVAQDELVALVGDVAAAGFVVSGPLKGLAAEEGVAADGLRGSHTKGSSATGVGPEHPGRSGRVGPAQHLCLNAYHLRRPGEKHDHQGHRARTSEFRP